MERCKREGRGEADRGTRRELLSQRAFRAPLARVSSRDDVRSGLFIAVKNTSKCPPSRHGSAGRAIRDVFSLSLFLSFYLSLSLFLDLRPPARSNSPDALSSPTRSYLSFVPTDEVPHSPTLTLGKLATYERRRIQAPRGEVGILFEGQPSLPLLPASLPYFLSVATAEDTALMSGLEKERKTPPHVSHVPPFLRLFHLLPPPPPPTS